MSDQSDVGFEERRDVSHVLGVVVRLADVPVLQAGRGPGFDRLVWLGEALLAVLLERARASQVHPPVTVDVARLLPLVEVEPDPHDLVRAAVAAGHRSADWSGVRAVVTRLVDPALGPEPRLPQGFAPEQAQAAGRTVLRAAASLLLVAQSPEAEVAALEQRREALLTPVQDTAEVGRVLVVKGEQAAVHAALGLLRQPR